MRVSTLIFSAFSAVLLISAASADTCLLKSPGLVLSNGWELSYPWSQETINYFCSCAFSSEWTTLKVTPLESGATVTLSLNGNLVPGFSWPQESPRLNFNVGENLIDVHVTCQDCDLHHTITCTREPPKGGEVQGDPMFTGLRGQIYQVHGVAGAVYNLVSDEQIQVNSKFVFLTKGKCPIINGKRAKTCFAHPGSYLGEIGIKTVSGDKIKLISGSSTQGYQSVTVNDVELGLHQTINLPNNVQVSRNGTHIVTFTGSTFTFEFENSDLFINQKVMVNDWDQISSHGLLGQTWNNKVYQGSIKFIEGNVDDYVIQENNVFGDSFTFNKFKVAQQ